MKKIFLLISLLLSSEMFAQVGISATNAAPNASAMLDVSSTTKGLLPPRMTSSQRTSIPSPANGLLVFDSDTQSYWFRQNGAWTELPKGGSTNNYWQLNGVGGNEIQNTNSGGLWSINPVGLSTFATNASNPPTAPISGAGTRMMWIPSRSAFRVGTVYSFPTHWDQANVGLFSFASGLDTKASGAYSTSMGSNNVASGAYSTVFGNNNFAIGYFSTAMGSNTTANGSYSTAIGSNTTASGYASTSIGELSTASGLVSTAIGESSVASGFYSIAIGNTSLADGENSIALGYKASTGGHQNSICFGASSGGAFPVVQNENDNEFMVYAQRYRFWTSNAGTSVYLTSGSNAWLSSCDRNKKENFANVESEEVLKKLSAVKYSSWNYIGQDSKTFRHYGIMAQDFYKAFGKDKYGTIGCDTIVNPIDMLGIAYSAIQALEKRTQILQVENIKLISQVIELQGLKSRITKLEAVLNIQNKESKLEKVVRDK